MLIHAQFFHNLGRKISHEIFVKIENTVYLSNQLTFAIFDLVMMFPIKNWTFEQILVFSISEMYLPCPTPTVKYDKIKRPLVWHVRQRKFNDPLLILLRRVLYTHVVAFIF